MQNIYHLFFLVLCVSCSSSQKVIEFEDATPDWVKTHPVSETHYIGIGIANKAKNPLDYIQIAQQNALQNLASQIKVNIATQSVFVQLEREYSFEEEFKSDIRIKAEEHLEEYELKGTHQQGDKFWVYYNLNKNTYAKIRQARMEQAMEQAKALLQYTFREYSLKERYIHFVKSLEVLKPYLSEPLSCKLDGRNVFLGSEIIAQFRNFMDDFRIHSLNKKVKVMIGNKVGELKFSVEFNKERIENIPLVFASEIIDVQAFSNVTNEKGIFTAIIPKITANEAIQKMQVGIDTELWLDEATQDKFIKKLARGVKSHQITMPIYVYTPSIFVQTEEKIFDLNSSQQKLKIAAETTLNKLGFKPTSKKNEAELIMSIASNTHKGSAQPNQKMFTAFLNMSVQVKDRKNMIIYSEELNKLKGIQLSFEQANIKVYDNAQDELNSNIIPSFVNSFTK